jgi:GMP synthase-like glutamine amidotransferase
VSPDRTPPRVLVVEHEAAAGLGRLDPLPGCELVVVRPYLGDALPADLAGVDGLVVLGGAMDAWDDAGTPWLPATRSLLRQAVAAGVPALGICLGAQLLAMACDAPVGRGALGPELGLVRVTLLDAAADDPFAAALPRQVPAPQGHFDVISELPEGSVLLASSPTYRHQAFRVGECAWGVQYHPEVTEDDFATWMTGDADALAAQGRTPEQAVAELVGAREVLDASARVHAEAFAAVVRAAAGAR